MKVGHSRSAAPNGRRKPGAHSRSQTESRPGWHGEVEAPRRPPAGPHVASRSFGGALAVQVIGDFGETGRAAGELDPGILAELQRLHLGLFDGWLCEEQLGRLAETAYRAAPSADDPTPERVRGDETDLRAAGAPAQQTGHIKGGERQTR